MQELWDLLHSHDKVESTQNNQNNLKAFQKGLFYANILRKIKTKNDQKNAQEEQGSSNAI